MSEEIATPGAVAIGAAAGASEPRAASVTLVESEGALAARATALASARRVAFDLEGDGMFAYRAQICAAQLAAEGHVVLVDALKTPLAPLGPLLGARGPVKILHDVAFDARMLAEVGIVLGNVHDTAIAARMVGMQATGLATLVGAELGLSLDKALQHHDWRERPFDERTLAYLARDVLYLEALEEALWRRVKGLGIELEVLEETRYRIDCAVSAAREESVVSRPPYLRIKGIEAASAVERAVARRVAEVREEEAKRRDIPPQRVFPNDVVLYLARARPLSADRLGKVRALGGRDQAHLARAILDAIRKGILDGNIPAEEARTLEKPRLPPDLVRARKARETRLSSWRRAEAKHRGVDEQVVLPGHCMKDIAGRAVACQGDLEAVPGFGSFRAERDGAAILAALADLPLPSEPHEGA